MILYSAQKSAFMFLGFSERAVTFYVYVTNTLVLATQKDCANSAVKTELLNVIRITLGLKSIKSL
jgi:hypothetical protein